MHRLIGTFSAIFLVIVGATTVFADEKPAAGTSERQAILALLTQLETGFNEGNAKGLAACWTENGEFVGPAGAQADGRENIEKQFKEAFAARKETKLQIHVNRFRLVNGGLALVDATAEVKPAVATGGAPVVAFVLVKQNGYWLIESARETITRLPSQTNHLKAIQWLVGRWSSETSKAGITLHTDCEWTSSQAFLIRKFRVEGKETFLHGGTEIIGWDPRTSRIRSWVFDSDGGFGENVWVHDGNRWLVKYSGILADGSEASATHILTNVDAATSTLQSKDRVLNGAAQPDIPETELKRQVETKPAAKAEEATKPVEKAAP
ncbi:MAG: SgcJ/EcaC family oxidoreductase [Planctomycetota bacterium]